MGSKVSREGILCNEIYRGRSIWNMKSKSINPDTGGVNYYMNPESEWQVTQLEHLRLISEELWAKCEVRKYAKKSTKKDGKEERIRKINPFRSLVFCGVCGSNKNLANKKRYVCSSFKYHRTCGNGRGINLENLTQEVIDFLKHDLKRLSSKEWLENFEQRMIQEDHEKNALHNQVVEISSKISRVVDIIDDDEFDIAELKEKLRKLQYERAQVMAKIEQTSTKIDTPIQETFSNALSSLHERLLEPQDNDHNRIELLALIKSITLSPTEQYRGETLFIEMQPNAWLTYYRLLQTQQEQA